MTVEKRETIPMTDLYLATHICETPDCLGNPRVVDTETLERVKQEFSDWNVDENGIITSTGDEKWKRDNKIFIAKPLFEDEDALGLAQRVLTSILIPDCSFTAELTVNWDEIPEAVKNSEAAMQNLADAKSAHYSRESIMLFMRDPEIVNVKFDPETFIISGYDAIACTTYKFTPVIN